MEGALSLDSILGSGSIAMVILALVKWSIRRFTTDSDYDFPLYFYGLAIPFLTAVVGIGLGYAGLTAPVVFEWKTLLEWLLAIIVMVASYELGLRPLKEYRYELAVNQEMSDMQDELSAGSDATR